MKQWSLLAVVLLAMAGCLSDGPTNDEQGGAAPSASSPAEVVVAVMDSGVDVYHEFYQATSLSQETLDRFVNTIDGASPRSIQLTNTGTYEERFEADAEIWAGIGSGELVYFEGTRVLGISLEPDAHPVYDDGSHGTGTTTSVLQANPDAIVVLVEGVGRSAGEKWAAEQPWVDILSESYGLYCGQPAAELVPGDSTAKNNKVAFDNGKLVVGAADNTPCPANHDGTSGPPWVVGVAGDHPETEGGCREPISGNFPDFTADFTQELSMSGTLNETRSMSGTSFSTPTTAGTFSKILQEVREAWGHEGGIVDGALAIDPEGGPLTNEDLRHAMEMSATYFGFNTGCDETGSVPTSPAAPWVQMGWGHVGPEVVAPAVAMIVDGVVPEKDPQAVQYNQAQRDYREAIWGLFIA